MTRQALSTANRSEVSSVKVTEILFVRITFSSGAWNFCTGDKPYTFGGHTYHPKSIGGVDSINENMDGSAEQAVLTIGGCDADLLAAVQVSDAHWTPVSMWLGYVDENHDLVDDPLPIYGGFVGAPTIQTSQKTSMLLISLETLNTALATTSQVRGCNADQQVRFAGDTGFNQVGVNGKRTIAFGNSRQKTGGGDKTYVPAETWNLPEGAGGPAFGSITDPFAPARPF